MKGRRQTVLKSKCKIALLLTLATLAGVLSVSVPSASALTPPGFSPDPLSWWAVENSPLQGCVTGIANVGGLCAGGDGHSIYDVMQNVKSYITPAAPTVPTSPLPPEVSPAITEIEVGTKVLPALSLVSALRSISIGVGGFSAGWVIGSTLNEKWLHIAGVGLGTTAAVPSANTNIKWVYENPNPLSGMTQTPQYVLSDGSAGTRLPAGWYLFHDNAGCSTTNVPFRILTNEEGGFSSTPSCDQAAGAAAIPSMGASGSFIDAGWTSGSGTVRGQTSIYYIPQANMPSALVTDQPMQNYVGQPFTLTTAWPTPGAQGDVSDSTTSLATAGDPWSCVTQLSATRCINASTASTAFPAPTATGGPITIPGLPADPTYTDPGQNLVRCINAPSLFNCPTYSGSTLTDPGGAKFIFPDLTGLSVIDAETQINSWFASSSWAAPAFTITTLSTGGAVITKPAGAVITTSPAGGATVLTAPTTVTITKNPDVLPTVIPLPKPWETGTEYSKRLAELGLKVQLVPVTAPIPGYGPTEVLAPGDAPVGDQWQQDTPTAGTTVVPGTTRAIPGTTTVSVPINIDTATFPPGDPNPQGTSTTPDVGSGSPITFPSIASPCDKFPFGIFCWITDQFTAITDATPIPWHVNVDFPSITTPGGMGISSKTFDMPSFAWDFGDPPATAAPFVTQIAGSDYLGTGGLFGFIRDILGLFLWTWGLWVYGKRKFGGKGLPDGDGTLPEDVG
jgi:hypothetical protein